MRLIPFTLPLLLLVSSALGAPTGQQCSCAPTTTTAAPCSCTTTTEAPTAAPCRCEPTTTAAPAAAPCSCNYPTPAADVTSPRTTIEVVVENVTRTIIHEVTTPATEPTTTEPSCSCTTTTQAPTAAPCSCTTTTAAPTAAPCSCTTTTQAPAAAPCSCNYPTPAADVTSPRTTIETVVEHVTRTVIHEVTEPSCSCTTTTEAPTAGPCSCDSGADYPAPASDAIVTGVSIEGEEAVEEIRTCDCKETKACRTESLSTIDTCMEECNEHLEVFGSKTEEYRKCFSKNNASIIEAEECLFKDVKCKDDKIVEDPTDWDSLSEIAYESNADETLANNYLWKRDEKKYTNIQTFFHCTKNCMHKKIQECSSEKKCTIQMPGAEEFATKMRECTKKNYKITQSIFSACQCLAWQNGVTDLRGSCAVVGNSFYIDRA